MQTYSVKVIFETQAYREYASLGIFLKERGKYFYRKDFLINFCTHVLDVGSNKAGAGWQLTNTLRRKIFILTSNSII